MSIREVIKNSKSLKQVLLKMKLSLKPKNYIYVRDLIELEGIDVSHFNRKAKLEYPKDDLLRSLVPKVVSILHLSDELIKLGKHCDPKYLKSKLLDLKLDFSHFSGRWVSKSSEVYPIEQYLVKNSSRRGDSSLKHRLWKLNLLRRECYWCNLTAWRNLPAPLELDHINGDPFDNRLENLRILCPNCHAQTDTANGKNTMKCKQKNGDPTRT